MKIVQRGDTAEEMGKREARFIREVNLLSRVQHKNLVKVWPFSKFLTSVFNLERFT